MSTGATDGLFLRNAGIPTFGVDGLFDDIDDVRAHGRDERVGVKQFFEDLEFQDPVDHDPISLTRRLKPPLYAL